MSLIVQCLCVSDACDEVCLLTRSLSVHSCLVLNHVNRQRIVGKAPEQNRSEKLLSLSFGFALGMGGYPRRRQGWGGAHVPGGCRQGGGVG